MKRFSAILAIAAACAADVHAAQPPATLPPVLVTGRVIDYEGAGMKHAEVRVRKGATLLARSAVGTFAADTSANYAVSVPMANTAIATAACAGDSLTVEVDDGMATYTNENATISVAAPGQAIRLDLRAASCTNPYGVSDLYLTDVTEWALAWGYDGFLDANGNYRPDADYDGDGVTNYKEYLAGSDPFDASDAGLKILTWREAEGETPLMVATFLASPNRAYSAERAGKGEGKEIGAFALTPHLEAKESGTARNYLNTDGGYPDIHEIYLYKDGDTGFFRLRQD